MATERNPVLTVSVITHSHYSDCEPWLIANVGEWNAAWWRDFPDIAMAAFDPQPDRYWFTCEQDAVLFRLRWP